MDKYIFLAEIFIKEISLKIKDKLMEKCFGQMDLFLKVNGNKEFRMVKGNYIFLVEKL
jgi:hypothetical protein